MSAPPTEPVSKFHHYVARMHLARFATAGERLWVYDKRARKSFDRSIADAFGETHLNAIDRPDGTRDQSLEHSLSELETRAKPVIDKILEAARAGVSPDIDPAERRTWDEYYIAQFSRAPDIFNAVPTLQIGHAIIEKLAGHLKERFPDRAAEADSLTEETERKRLLKTARIQSQRVPSERLMAIFESKTLVALTPGAPEKSFIIGSNPFVRWGDDLRKTETRLWLPIAPYVAVGPGEVGTGATLVFFDNPSDTDRFNLTIARRSTVFASDNRAALDCLVAEL